MTKSMFMEANIDQNKRINLNKKEKKWLRFLLEKTVKDNSRFSKKKFKTVFLKKLFS